MSNTLIKDLLGFPYLPSLKSIFFKGSPITSVLQYRIAIAIVSSVSQIDGQIVSPLEQQIVSRYPKECYSLILSGWMPSATPPSRQEVIKLQEKYVEKRMPQKQKTKVKPSIITVTEYISEQEDEIKRLEKEIQELSHKN